MQFLDTLIDLNDDSEAKRKTLIERFVKKVIVYNDKIVLELKALGDVSVNNDIASTKGGENGAVMPTAIHQGPPKGKCSRNI